MLMLLTFVNARFILFRRRIFLLAGLIMLMTTWDLGAETDLNSFDQEYYHGAAYYPELWPEENVDGDIARMKEEGINLVRMGEFAWAKMEPQEGSISLDFFIRVMDKLHQAGIGVVFCTPTATPPIWLSYGHPERAFVDANGERMSHGARQHMSDDDPAVIAATQKIVEAIAKAVGKHPALVAWQIDNEFKCHVGEDFNESSVALWHQWLEKRYGTIDRLNDAWGTMIWSEYYQNFDQVQAPVRTPFAQNASLTTAYQLFTYDRIADYMDSQSSIIRKYSDKPITTNTSEGFGVSSERMSRNLDFVSFDAYPSYQGWIQLVFKCDLFRSLKPGRPFWIMETSSSHNGWLRDSGTPHPTDYLPAEAAMSYGLGAHAFNYWLWRQQRTGVELEHSALLTAWGAPGLGYEEVKKVTGMLEKLGPLLKDSKPAIASAAVTWSDRGRAFIQSDPFGDNVDYGNVISDWHAHLVQLGIDRDIRPEGASLDGLKLLITPAMPFVSQAFLDRVKPWIEAGGIWIAGPLTGQRTEDETVPTDAGLGALEKFAGVETMFSFPMKGTDTVGHAFDVRAPLSGWCMAVRPASPDTRVMGTIQNSLPPDHLAFLTERKIGRGKIVLLTTQPDGNDGGQMLSKLIDHYAAEAGISRFTTTPGTMICPRIASDGKDVWLVVNIDGKGGRVILPKNGVDVLTGDKLSSGPLELKPYGYDAVKF
jgi:beta-galactosidase